ncbi:gamma-glutamyl-gamma-aminobutyrate hydrolase family protein [Caldalkalibacillus salinus]|uniref:gamma-glutamyl-gamma-aminobutyrate hydrolase family protein n=1 Tax=Caldalkalibacillus salinus TaxID=2803787 RepID=UPI001921CC66|nr:gamma-glutamyl-gamma-aminobutyrate hydrolase family protein [Caldalkalibacillus salinus]
MKKPIIGITASLEEAHVKVKRYYADWIFNQGGIPFIIPYTTDETQLQSLTEQIDGLLLAGGGDIDPTLFEEEPVPGLGSITPERDTLELSLAKHALESDIPILAICRGIQILNVAAGGNMYQDLDTQYGEKSLLQHMQVAPTWHASHTVAITPSSKLHAIVGSEKVKTNSFHHQAVKDAAPGFIVSAESTDGVVEAIESLKHSYVIGVQWHPECMPLTHHPSRAMFQSFVGACQQV